MLRKSTVLTAAFRSGGSWIRSARRQCAAALRNTSGVAAIYVGLVGALLVGSGGLAIDIGRIMVLRGEMQNMADSAALSGAVYLDGSSGSRARAEAVATEAILLGSGLANTDTTLGVATVTFYRIYERGGVQVVANGDTDAGYIRVDLDPKTVNILLKPIYELVTGATGSNTLTLNTFAVAEWRPIACEIVPLMVCATFDPTDADWQYSVLNNANIGKQYVMKRGPGDVMSKAPGNFGLLEAAATGAKAVNAALGTPGANACGGDVVETQPGSETQMVINGINSRFGVQSNGNSGVDANPATSVKEYYDDATPPGADGRPGGGDWNPELYWENHHDGHTDQTTDDNIADADDIPADLAAAVQFFAGAPDVPTRYQTYLYEIGTSFAIDPTNQAHTAFPSNVSPAGWTIVTPLFNNNPPVQEYVHDGPMPLQGDQSDYTNTWVPVGPDFPAASLTGPVGSPQLDGFTGIPEDPEDFSDPAYCSSLTAMECQIRHRTVLVVAADCGALNLNGKSVLEGPMRFIRFFITRRSEAPPVGDIKGELVGPETAMGLGDSVKNGSIIGNVRLID